VTVSREKLLRKTRQFDINGHYPPSARVAVRERCENLLSMWRQSHCNCL